MNIVVGVSDMKVSKDPDSVLVTYSLGSCIGVSIWDRVAHVGGMLHFMLPESSLDPEKARANPFMFADTGIPALFKAAYALGAKKQQMKVVVVGGAQVLDQQGFFNIGKRNHMAIRKIFWKNNVMVDYENVGGNTNRTLKLTVRDGKIWLKVSGQGVTEI
ncbi:MAG: chemotaxis protein CheD [Desulfobacteraceae bacterium]|nr:MAG: chemotaxis protein CheD [Desulfobacteraceae bacterium]